MNLEIFIITYNRAFNLEKTLKYFVGSVLKDYNITILDNCSTDSTFLLYPKFKFYLPNLKYVKNKINIGGNANILRAIELSNSKFTWVACDDDILDFSQFEDVLEVIEKDEVNLIHIGGHYQKKWSFGGELDTPKKLLGKGYPYFKFSSFLPTSIFRTGLFQSKFLIPGYENIINAYPHMPYLINIFYKDEPIYISKKQIVTAIMGGQSYSLSDWYIWWIRTCQLLNTKEDVRLAFLDQWNNIDQKNEINGVRDLYCYKMEHNDNKIVDYFINTYFNTDDKQFIQQLSRRMEWNNKKQKLISKFPFFYNVLKNKFKKIKDSEA